MAILFKASLLLAALLVASVAGAQDVPPPTATPTAVQWPPFPAGMRLLVGSTGVLARNTPSMTGTCGSPAHDCTPGDAVPPGQYGVVQLDPPVFEAAGWWWIRVAYENGVTGWSSGYPPYLNQLTPPQMAQGFNFRVAADYAGATLTQGVCISDGVQSAATLNLQPQPGGTGQTGTISCPWNAPAIGNHIAVLRAVNNAGMMDSTEFQFSVTAKVVPQPPSQPSNLRITPIDLTTAAIKSAK